MAVSIPASPSVSSYFDTEPDQSKLFPDDSMSIGLYTTFGEDDSNTSFGSWPDPYSCSEVSSFPTVDSSFTESDPGQQLVLPTEDDINFGGTTSEFLQQYGPCNSNNSRSAILHSNFVDTLKNMATPDEYIAEDEEVAQENQFGPQQLEKSKSHYAEAGATELRFVVDKEGGSSLEEVCRAPELLHNSQLEDEKDSTSPVSGSLEEPESRRSEYNDFEGRTHLELPDCFQISNDDDSVTTSLEEEPQEADGVHIPPPLNMKRIEMYDDAYYESIEAAEVPVDVIENKRPFQCGLAGCNKTFKNPQTMKMHHKTHFTDGTAAHLLDVPLPMLTPTAAGAGWMSGRNKKIPSRCPKCRKTFVGLYELRRHYGRKHSEGERPFQCRKCDKRFYIEVDVRDHEKLCGEQIECKCGLKFAFRCNMVAHKKAHPACQDDPIPQPNQTSTSVTINANSNTSSNSNNSNNSNNSSYQSLDVLTTLTTQSPTISDEDSSVSWWIRPRTSRSLRPRGTKRCHELVEETRPDLMSRTKKVYSRRTGAPAQNFRGLGQVEDATSFTDYDFTGLGFATDGISLWSPSNVHYPSLPGSLPGLEPGPVKSVLCGWEQSRWEHLGSQIQQAHRRSGPGRLSALDLLQLAGVTPGL